MYRLTFAQCCSQFVRHLSFIARYPIDTLCMIRAFISWHTRYVRASMPYSRPDVKTLECVGPIPGPIQWAWNRGTDTDFKAREKSAVKLFATCQLCSVGRTVNCLIFFIFAELGSFRFV